MLLIAAAAALTLAPSNREPLYPDPITIKGMAPDGPVVLEVDEFPYDDFVDYQTTVSDRTYSFKKVILQKNSRVRVRAGGERSKKTTIYVHPGVKSKYRSVSGDTKVKISFTYLGHPGFAPPENAFYAYIFINDEPRARRFTGPRKLKQIADGTWRFAKTLDLPARSQNYEYSLVFCTHRLAELGYGKAYRVDRNCGDKVIPWPNAN
jgi:hypothetical protein